MRILLADDHDLVRDAIQSYVQRLDPSIVVETARTLAEAETAAAGARYDVILLDLHMPGMNGLAGLGAMVERYPDTPVCLISGAMRHEDVLQALDLGAAGCLPKTLSGEPLVEALRQVVAGEIYLPHGLPGAEAPSPTAAALATLTGRERDVLLLVAKGLSNKEIGRILKLQEVTIKLHLRSIFRKLGVRNRTQAARAIGESAVANGLAFSA